MPAPEPAIAIARYEGHDVDVRPGDSADDELRGDMSEVSSSSLLPRCDEGTCAVVVDDRRSGRREREPPACALGTAPNGPRSWRTAAVAQRRRATDEPLHAHAANRCADTPADGAP